jgi:stalled ribosome alternative rescue factor ArfA
MAKKRRYKRPKVVKTVEDTRPKVRKLNLMGNPLFGKKVEAKKKGKGSYNRKKVRKADFSCLAA